jgi:hypothetical protein
VLNSILINHLNFDLNNRMKILVAKKMSATLGVDIAKKEKRRFFFLVPGNSKQCQDQ